MAESLSPKLDSSYLAKAIEVSVRLALLAGLAVWCFRLMWPFITPVVWGIILAVAVFPAYRWIALRLGGRQKAAAVLVSLLGIAIVLVPAGLFTGSIIESGQDIVAQIDAGSVGVPPPPDEVNEWPLIGPTVHKYWTRATVSLEPVFAHFAPQLGAFAKWLISAGMGVGLGILQLLISIAIGGVLLAGAAGGHEIVLRVADRLTDGYGAKFTKMAADTVRSVAVGIIGVALIQSALISAGLFLVGVPHAGVWAIICLMFAIVQLPPLLVVLPIIAYVFSAHSTSVAVVFMIWEVLAAGSDNFLKPILLARGVDVPMVVIFMGAIGGFIASGFIGLFVGAVVLSLGYDMARYWITGEQQMPDPDAVPSS